jgi:hypothetical protein
VACGLGGGWGVAASARGQCAGRWFSAPFPSAPLLLAGLGGEGKQEWMEVREASSLFFIKGVSLCFVFPKGSLLTFYDV